MARPTTFPLTKAIVGGALISSGIAGLTASPPPLLIWTIIGSSAAIAFGIFFLTVAISQGAKAKKQNPVSVSSEK